MNTHQSAECGVRSAELRTFLLRTPNSELRTQHGSVLLYVVWAIALLSLFAASIGSRAIFSLGLTERFTDQLRAVYLARGAAHYAALTSGFRVWQRASEAGTATQSALVAFDQFNKDLRAYRRSTLVPFDGAYDAFTVPAVRRSSRDPAAPKELGGLTYFLDARRQTLCRSFVPYRLSRRLRPRERCEPILDHVSRLRFDYFGAEHAQADPGWSASWESDSPPTAVKASVTIEEPGRRPTSRSWLVSMARPTPPPTQ